MARVQFNLLVAVVIIVSWSVFDGANSLAISNKQQRQKQQQQHQHASAGATPDGSAPSLKLMSAKLLQEGGNLGPDSWMNWQKQRQLLSDLGASFELPGLHDGAADESGNDGFSAMPDRLSSAASDPDAANSRALLERTRTDSRKNYASQEMAYLFADSADAIESAAAAEAPTRMAAAASSSTRLFSRLSPESTRTRPGEHAVPTAAGSEPSLARRCESCDSWAGRKLRQFVGNSRSDRITQAMAAAQTAIARAVSYGAGRSAMQAAAKGMNYAKLTTQVSADPWEFARRKLQQTNSRSDRISQALSAAQGAIERAVSSGASPRDARGAANANLAYAKMTTQPATDPWQFGRKLRQAATNSRSDRITQALSAAHDAIERAVSSGASPRDARGAANANLAYAKMTTQPATDPWQFGRK